VAVCRWEQLALTTDNGPKTRRVSKDYSRTKETQTRTKKWLFCLICIGIVYCSVELLSFLFTKAFVSYGPANVISKRHADIIERLLRDETSYIKLSPELGWTIREYGKDEWYTANSDGIRGTKEYKLIPSAGKFRIMICGDGFTHCNDVRDDETWPVLLEQMNTEWEVLNLGVWGHALDQVYLRYQRKGKKYKAHAVLIGFGTGNIYRLVNTYRPTIFRHTGLPFTKPRFRMEDGTLQLVPNPMRNLDDYRTLLNKPEETIPRIAADDYYYERRFRPNALDVSPTIKLARMVFAKLREDHDNAVLFERDYTHNTKALEIMRRLVDEFHQSVVQTGAIPVFCIFPVRNDIERYRASRTKLYSILLKYFDSKGYKYIDALHAFDELDKNFDINDLYLHFFTTLGNEYIAKYMYESLTEIL
jgi:hypothetical protein